MADTRTAQRPSAGDDVVRRVEDVGPKARPPLLVLEPLIAYLDEHGIGEGDVHVNPVSGELSNVTYIVRRAGAEVVLRRPPRPLFPPTTHDVLREARVLKGLASSARVPTVVSVCPDATVI